MKHLETDIRVHQRLAEAVLSKMDEQAVKRVLRPDQLKRMKKWIKKQNPSLTQIEAISRLVDMGLDAESRAKGLNTARRT
ncbi:putative membrane protein [Bradyrhizobium sp. USDA 4474]